MLLAPLWSLDRAKRFADAAVIMSLLAELHVDTLNLGAVDSCPAEHKNPTVHNRIDYLSRAVSYAKSSDARGAGFGEHLHCLEIYCSIKIISILKLSCHGKTTSCSTILN